MHPRKPQRTSDGYYDKHSGHPYQGSKYNSKGERRIVHEYNSLDYAPMRSPRHEPGGMMPHSHGHPPHMVHAVHDSHYTGHYVEVDPRMYSAPKPSYYQKVSEKDRDREYKSSRERYIETLRSPKDKRSKDFDRERNIPERVEVVEPKKRASATRNVGSSGTKFDKRNLPAASTTPGNEWSEHISSSGKKYYYNCISEVSQWEKPREYGKKRTPSKETYRSHEKRAGSRSRRESEREREKDRNPKRTSTAVYWEGRPSREGVVPEPVGRERPRNKNPPANYEKPNLLLQQEIDVAPSPAVHIPEMYKKVATEVSKPATSTSHASHPPQKIPEKTTTPAAMMSTSLLAAALPRMQAQAAIQHHHHSMPVHGNQHAHVMQHHGPRATATITSASSIIMQDETFISRKECSIFIASMIASPVDASAAGGSTTPGGATPLQSDGGPPTPTHSEMADIGATHTQMPQQPSVTVLENVMIRKLPDYMGSHGGYSSTIPALPPLNPSLANFVRPDLTAHVTGWPSEILEKQAQKYTEEAFQLGCLQCTRVSSELKCSRSLVRHLEIMATLQEQKLMYMRQQITRLEDLKSSSTTFMSDDF